MVCVSFHLQVLNRVPAGHVRHLLSGAFDGLRIAVRPPRVIVTVIASTALVWVLEGSMFWYGMIVLGIDAPLPAALFVLGVVNLGLLLPTRPGYLGLFQYFAVLPLGVFAVPEAHAFAFSVVVHACQYVPITVAGFAFLVHFGFGSFREAAE